jgi:hypothetical protein
VLLTFLPGDFWSRVQDGDRHKAPGRHIPGELGITSEEGGNRADATRFFMEGKHFGKLDPLRASVENPDGSHTVAGVTTSQGPHEVDRFDAPTGHRGRINPNRASVVNPDGTSTVAGVTTSQGPHEVDRFDAPRGHFGGQTAGQGQARTSTISAHEGQAQPYRTHRSRQAPGGTSSFTFG